MTVSADGHFRRDRSFVDEDQPVQVKVEQTVELGLAQLCEIGPWLRAGVRRFLHGNIVKVKAAPMFRSKLLRQCDKEDVSPSCNHS